MKLVPAMRQLPEGRSHVTRSSLAFPSPQRGKHSVSQGLLFLATLRGGAFPSLRGDGSKVLLLVASLFLGWGVMSWSGSMASSTGQ